MYVALCFPLLQIVLQTLLAFAVTCYGIVHIAGEFRDMDATSELKNKYVLFLFINVYLLLFLQTEHISGVARSLARVFVNVCCRQ